MFYLLQAPSERTYQYAYKDASFVGFHKSECGECGRVIASLEYSGDPCLLVEGAAKYPDHLSFHGAGAALFVISERAAAVFQTAGFTGLAEFTPIKVMRIKNNAMIPLPDTAPNY